MKKLNQFCLILVVLFSFSGVSVFAQEMNITGVVIDNEGFTVPGVSISEKGTTNGTITDLDGNYTIKVSKGSTLLFSYIGYEAQEIRVDNNEKIDVTLRPSTVGLDEIIVVGYGTQSRRTITSAITKVGGETLQNIPINSVGDGLKGKIAGARLYSNNNTPGSDAVIRIRGGSSINKSNDPLILVDGVERAFSGLNPNDIESIEVLKDAASTAIYGSRASNGVVLITTKKGTRRKSPNITFEANVALQEAETLYDFMNAEDYIRTVRPAIAVGPNARFNSMDGYSASSANTETSIYSTRYLKDGETIPAGYKAMPDPLDPTKTLIFQDNNFQDEIYKKAAWQNYYVGIDGGAENIRYTASLGYTDDDGVALATGFSRLSTRVGIDVDINKYLTFAAGFDYSKTDSEEYENQMNTISRGLATPPTQKKYNEDGTPTKGYNATSPNPVWYEYYHDRSKTDKRLSVFGKLTYRIFDGLKADVQLSTYNHHYKFDSFTKAHEFNGLRPTTGTFDELGRDKLEAYGTYSKTISSHSFSVMGGYSYQKDKRQNMSASVTGASSDKVPTLTAGPNKTAATSSFTEDVTIGYFGRISYDFQKKYLFSATFREDASSRFASGNQWGFFPGASVGWVISDEEFMKSARKLDNLKLRVSYGQTGNNSIGLYDAYGKYSTSARYNGVAGILPSTMPNTDLTWEVSTQLDLGFDLSMLNNRLSVSADYFDKRTDNLLFSKDLPNTSGFSNVQTNIGKVKFYGFDVEIASTNIQTENFDWTSKFTWSFVKNKVLKLPDNGRDKNRIGGITLADGTAFGGTAEGESLYRYYGYKVDYIIETQAQADNAMYDSSAKGYRHSDGKRVAGRKEIGDYEWKNRDGSLQRNGADYIDSQDQFLLGYTVPHSTGGLNNTLRYKNFSLNIFLDWALGHSINQNSEMRYFMNTFANNYTLIDEVKKCWTQPGDNTKYARFTANDPDDGNANFSRTSNIFNYKGDYLCIREVVLQYNLPFEKIARLGMQQLAITLSGNNLHYFTAVKGVSPEVGASPASLNMLKADYSLWMYKVRNGGDTYLDKAATAVDAVLINSNYELENNFASVFENELGKEIIFAWSYIQDEYTGGYPADYLVPSQYISAEYIENPVKVGSHQQWCFYTEEYKALLSENENDQRTIVSFETFYDDQKNGTFQWINKFAGSWMNGTRIFDADIIVYRYADALLFDAEIKNARNNPTAAVEALNKIAERAYGTSGFYASSLSKTAIDEAILTERLKEFPAEGKLWWDYIRFNVAFERNPYLKGRENELNVLLWPVAATSINKNPNITQTPGYDG